MAVGKSRRIVIDVDDVMLKRRLYAALAEDGLSLKCWFIKAVSDYLEFRISGRQLELTGLRAADPSPSYGRSGTRKSET